MAERKREFNDDNSPKTGTKPKKQNSSPVQRNRLRRSTISGLKSLSFSFEKPKKAVSALFRNITGNGKLSPSSSGSKLKRTSFKNPEFFDKYTISAVLIDRGSFSKVYKGRGKKIRSYVAVKIIPKRKMKGEFKRRFIENEINALKKLNNEFILEFIDVNEDNPRIYLVTELCEGGNLLSITAQYGQIPGNICAKIALNLGIALHYCHQNGVVHRDLKPENVFISVKIEDENDFSWVDSIKLGDFGCCYLTEFDEDEEQLYRMKTAVGSVGYKAPEVIAQNGFYTEAVDYWGMGMMLFVILSGYHPFIAEDSTPLEISNRIMSKDLIENEDAWEKVAPRLRDLTFSLLDHQVSNRMNFIEQSAFIYKHHLLANENGQYDV